MHVQLTEPDIAGAFWPETGAFWKASAGDWLPPLTAIILGIAARRQIRRTGERGTALATAGLALGALWIVLTPIVLL